MHILYVTKVNYHWRIRLETKDNVPYIWNFKFSVFQSWHARQTEPFCVLNSILRSKDKSFSFSSSLASIRSRNIVSSVISQVIHGVSVRNIELPCKSRDIPGIFVEGTCETPDIQIWMYFPKCSGRWLIPWSLTKKKSSGTGIKTAHLCLKKSSLSTRVKCLPNHPLSSLGMDTVPLLPRYGPSILDIFIKRLLTSSVSPAIAQF